MCVCEMSIIELIIRGEAQLKQDKSNPDNKCLEKINNAIELANLIKFYENLSLDERKKVNEKINNFVKNSLNKLIEQRELS